jgi:hypothetical protein
MLLMIPLTYNEIVELVGPYRVPKETIVMLELKLNVTV